MIRRLISRHIPTRFVHTRRCAQRPSHTTIVVSRMKTKVKRAVRIRSRRGTNHQQKVLWTRLLDNNSFNRDQSQSSGHIITATDVETRKVPTAISQIKADDKSYPTSIMKHQSCNKRSPRESKGQRPDGGYKTTTVPPQVVIGTGPPAIQKDREVDKKKTKRNKRKQR